LLFQSCEKDDTSAQIQLELNEIKTVSPENTIDYLNSFKKSKSKSLKNYLVAIGDTVSMENITNSSEKLAVIPVKTINGNLKSRILLLEIEGKVESVVFSTKTYDCSTKNSFSGEILITDLEGNFIDAFEIIEDNITAQYLSRRKDITANLQNRRIADDEGDDCGDGCPFSVCSWCGELETVVVVATPSAEHYTLSIDLLYSQGSNGTADGCEVGCDNYWNFSNDGGGGGFTNNTEDKIHNPCEELKAQIDDASYLAKFEELNNETGKQKETGYAENKDGSFTKHNPINNAHSLSLNGLDYKNLNGFIHTHLDDLKLAKL
tara:strand:+ start:157 stop:1116 length:960 start_codon:yes stop_codon:yes gene_type:complete